MGSAERRERERLELRQKIMDAARELFASEGYEAVTMRSIAKKIEYSPTAIYFHFRDKRALLDELCTTDFGALAHELAHLADVADPVERIRQAGIAYARFGLTHPNHYRLMFMTPLGGDAPAPDERKGNPQEDASALLLSAVDEAIAAGRLRQEHADPQLVSQTLWAGIHGVVALEIVQSENRWIDWCPIEDRLNAMLDVLLNGVLRKDG